MTALLAEAQTAQQADGKEMSIRELVESYLESKRYFVEEYLQSRYRGALEEEFEKYDQSAPKSLNIEAVLNYKTKKDMIRECQHEMSLLYNLQKGPNKDNEKEKKKWNNLNLEIGLMALSGKNIVNSSEQGAESLEEFLKGKSMKELKGMALAYLIKKQKGHKLSIKELYTHGFKTKVVEAMIRPFVEEGYLPTELWNFLPEEAKKVIKRGTFNYVYYSIKKSMKKRESRLADILSNSVISVNDSNKDLVASLFDLDTVISIDNMYNKINDGYKSKIEEFYKKEFDKKFEWKMLKGVKNLYPSLLRKRKKELMQGIFHRWLQSKDAEFIKDMIIQYNLALKYKPKGKEEAEIMASLAEIEPTEENIKTIKKEMSNIENIDDIYITLQRKQTAV